MDGLPEAQGKYSLKKKKAHHQQQQKKMICYLEGREIFNAGLPLVSLSQQK